MKSGQHGADLADSVETVGRAGTTGWCCGHQPVGAAAGWPVFQDQAVFPQCPSRSERPEQSAGGRAHFILQDSALIADPSNTL